MEDGERERQRRERERVRAACGKLVGYRAATSRTHPNEVAKEREGSAARGPGDRVGERARAEGSHKKQEKERRGGGGEGPSREGEGRLRGRPLPPYPPPPAAPRACQPLEGGALVAHLWFAGASKMAVVRLDCTRRLLSLLFTEIDQSFSEKF